MSDGKGEAADPIPATIGRYQITGSLGYGAMGAVYKAFDPLIKRPLAVKTVRLDVPRGSPQYRSFLERFQHEAQISGTLSHPGIVTLFDLGEEGGLPFFAMEFVDGRTVAEVLAAGERFKPEKVIALVSQVAAALDYAHSRGVIHRDIKPANLILYDGDKVKVTDFGIAKLADAEITHAGALLGTPSYMSPEQAMGEKLDGRSDIFSLGVVAFEMLSGLQPFPGPNVTSILYKLVHVDPIEPIDLETNGLVPQKWHEVFGKVLAKKPDQRYQTAGAFVQDLEYCLGSWFAGLGSEETVTLGPNDIPTAEIPRPAAVAPPPSAAAAAMPPARGGASPQVAVDDDETLLIPRPPAASAAPTPSAATTLVLESRPPLEGETTVTSPAAAAQTHPSVPTLPSLPTLPSALPGPAAARAARPGLPLGLVLGGGAVLLLGLVALFAWALRSRGAVPPAPAPAVAEAQPAEAAAPPVAPAAAAGAGTLRVVSVPSGARVLLDGRARGRTPLELAELAFGSYELRVEQPGHEPGQRTVRLSAEVPTLEVRLALERRAGPATGAADFVSTPAGAAVSVDGRPAGTTPLRAVRLQPGRRRVAITLDGHESWSSTLDVKAGETGRVEVRLRPQPAAQPVPEPVDVARVYPNVAGEVDTIATRVAGASPSYPSRRAPRLRSGQRVSVLVRFVVTEKGEVQDVAVEESAGPVVDEVVVEAVRKWTFAPATRRGVPVKVETSYRQTFLGG